MPGFVFLSRQVELLGVKIIEPVFLHNVVPVNWQRKKYTADTISFSDLFHFFWPGINWPEIWRPPTLRAVVSPGRTQRFYGKETMRVQVMTTTREFTQRRQRRQRERQKSSRFTQAKQQLCTCITLFCTSLCRRRRLQRKNCLISRFVEDGNKRQLLSFSFPELWCSPLEFNSINISQHLTNSKRWNKRDKVWGSANSVLSAVFVAVAVAVVVA